MGNLPLCPAPLKSKVAKSCCHAFDQDADQDESPAYFRRAKINAFFAIVLILLIISQFVPSMLIGLGLAILTALMMKYTGGEYYESAYQAFKNKSTNMNTLVALSTLIAWSYSVALCLFPQFFPIIALHYHFAEIGMILGIINVGRGFRFKAEYEVKKRTQDHTIFQKYQPLYAIRIGSKIVRIESSLIEVGDILEIRPNERFPVEGIIVSIANSKNRYTWIDQKNITGESELVKKSIGDGVLTGTLNKEHTTRIRATVKGNENNLRKLLKSFQMAPKSETANSELINKISRYFIPSILGIAMITGGSWLWLAPVTLNVLPLMIQSVMSVLLCACPCALGLAEPLSSSVSIHKLLDQGILVKKAISFERAGRIDTIIFDKTGTLTEPVVDMDNTEYFPELAYAASLEKYHTKSHPIATAMMRKFSHHHVVTKPITQAQGMTGCVQGIPMIVGSLEYCKNKGAYINNNYLYKAQVLSNQGKTTVFVICNLKCVGVIGLRHKVSQDARYHINALKARGIKIGLLTGDKKGPAQAIAKELGIDLSWVWYGCSTDQKLKKIQELKKIRKGVAMVGDGMNDIAACSAADIGIAIHAWTNAAVKCDVALQGSIGDIIQFLDVAKVVTCNIKQNLGWTFTYNAGALMGATGLFFPIISCALNPIIASGLMACSSIVVIMNARRLPHLIDQVLKKPMPVAVEPPKQVRQKKQSMPIYYQPHSHRASTLPLFPRPHSR